MPTSIKIRRLITVMMLCILGFGVAAYAEKKIGVIAPLTGPISEAGLTFQAAIRIAHEEAPHGTTLLFEDDQFSAKNAVSAAQRLISIEKVHALLVWGTPASVAVSEVAERARIPMVAVTMVERPFEGKKYAFRLAPRVKDQVALIVGTMRAVGVKAPAIVATENESMVDAADGVAESFGESVKMKETVGPGLSEVRQLALRIRQRTPDAIFMTLLPPTAALVARELAAVGFKRPIFGMVPMQLKSEVLHAQGALEGAVFTTFDDEAAIELRKKVSEMTKGSYMPDGAVGYDAYGILTTALDHAAPEETLQNIESYPGLFGRAWKEAPSNIFSMPIIVKTVKNNDFEVYSSP